MKIESKNFFILREKAKKRLLLALGITVFMIDFILLKTMPLFLRISIYDPLFIVFLAGIISFLFVFLFYGWAQIKCPQCGQRFGGGIVSRKTFTKKCLNCGFEE